LEIIYELPAHAESVNEVVKKVELLKRIEIARKFSILKQDGVDIAQFFIHPENLILISNQLYVAHRGLIGFIEPKKASCELFLKQYKALVISTINPAYKYEEVVTGKVKVRDRGLGKVLSASTITEVEQLLDEQYYALYTARKLTERIVKKSKYGVFKFLTIGFAVLLVGMGIWLGLLLENTVPRQNRIIDAQAAYMVNDYNKATSILSEDDPRTLPPAVQYMLAASYVQLSTLRIEQRQAITNNLSPSTNEIELRYWIYTGRGGLRSALDYAYRLDDIHFKINAYGNLYDYIYADMDRYGIQRQSYLDRYRQRMEELYELLNGVRLVQMPDDYGSYDYSYNYNDEGNEGNEENGED